MLHRVLLIKNKNVVHCEYVNSYFKCLLSGLVWKYFPDYTFKNRDYMIIDLKIIFYANSKSSFSKSIT